MATEIQKPGKPVTTPIRNKVDDEQALMAQLEEEEAKKAALDAAQLVASAQLAGMHQGAVNAASPPPAPVVRRAGDIPVTCLQTEPICMMGSRRYVLKKGEELLMDPCHAAELSSGPNPWVSPVRVITSK